MKTDIDAAGIGNLTVTATATVLTLTESNGNAINLYNGNADTGGYGYVGGSNTSGLPATTSATGTERLKLTRENDSNSGYYVYHSNGNECARLVHGGSGDEGTLILRDSGSVTVLLAGENGQNSYINSTNLGLGQSTPTYKLDILNGNLRLQTNTGFSANSQSYPTIFLNANHSSGNNPAHATMSVVHSNQNSYSGDLVFRPQGYYGSYQYVDVMKVTAYKTVAYDSGYGSVANVYGCRAWCQNNRGS